MGTRVETITERALFCTIWWWWAIIPMCFNGNIHYHYSTYSWVTCYQGHYPQKHWWHVSKTNWVHVSPAKVTLDSTRKRNPYRISPNQWIQVHLTSVSELTWHQLLCFRYLWALAVMYICMAFCATDIYDLLKPLLKDYWKLHVQSMVAWLCLTEDSLRGKYL